MECRGIELRRAPWPTSFPGAFATLRALDLDISTENHPERDPSPIPFEQDREHASYDGEQVTRFFHALAHADLCQGLRSRFIGKSSPVHFFWGASIWRITRFTTGTLPRAVSNLPDWVAREGVFARVSSCGSGSARQFPEPTFYAYAYPEPVGYADAAVRPGAARYDHGLSEFVLAYDAVRLAASPDADPAGVS